MVGQYISPGIIVSGALLRNFSTTIDITWKYTPFASRICLYKQKTRIIKLNADVIDLSLV